MNLKPSLSGDPPIIYDFPLSFDERPVKLAKRRHISSKLHKCFFSLSIFLFLEVNVSFSIILQNHLANQSSTGSPPADNFLSLTFVSLPFP